MANVGGPRTFHKRFQFLVEYGEESAAFQSCSDLAAEFDDVEQRQGGSVLAEKEPGLLNVDDITLERGSTQDRALFEWFRQVINMATQKGDVGEEYKRTIDIVQLDRDGSELVRWRVYGAWPKRYVGGAWDNTASENVIESVVLRLDWFDRVDR